MSLCVRLWLISFFLCAFAPLRETNAQVRPVYDYGAAGLAQSLKRLNTTKSVMMIGAHPDDEDSALLAYLARGENARTAYLSLTRGDGGQNIIGSELFEPLGIIRTEELLQARRLDGAEQFFTRAFDFGFTKTLDETKQKWDERVILCDTVRVIRMFRPLVVISRFSGTTADGHGQHQYAGYISPLAVRAAADANQCKDSGAAWQVLKFYVEQGFRDTSPPSLKINTGEYDYLLGRSYFEIAMEGRSQHRTQEQGSLELKGEQFSGLNLIESKLPKTEKETSVFDGIDVSIKKIPELAGFTKDFSPYDLTEIDDSVKQILREYQPGNAPKSIPLLIKTLQSVRRILGTSLCTTASNSGFDDCDRFTVEQRRAAAQNFVLLQIKKDELEKAIIRASGVKVDALADKEIVAPGEKLSVVVRVFIPKPAEVKVQTIDVQAPNNWTVTKIDTPKENAPRFRSEKADAAANFNVYVSRFDDQNIYTQPYWLEKPKNDALFDWANTHNNQNLPFAPPAANAAVIFEIGGTTVSISQPIEYRYADDIRGEIRRELNVVPKISLKLDQDLLIVPQSPMAQPRKIVLTVKNNSSEMISGTTDLKLPAGWKIKQDFGIFQLNKKGESKSFEFDVIVPVDVKTGSYEISAQATANGDETFTQTIYEIAYPHIQTHRFYTDAKTRVNVFDLKVAPVRVGYIMGSGDAVPEAIKQMNLAVDLLNETDLVSGDLSKYNTIVVGIRAYQVRQDLIANNQRLLDYVKNGGNLIVQYQRPDYVAQNFQPFPASMSDTQKTAAGTTARVVDENAKVVILDASNAIFNFPNRITDADFLGWVQERNLYNFTTFDAKYKPLLESHDAGEAENKGGLVVAEIGKGKYVYCSYALFRQLPAGVSGAYRLFANLLSLPKAK